MLSIPLFVFAILTVVAVSIAASFALFRWIGRRMHLAGQARVAERYSHGGVLRSAPTANFFGLESKGALQVRGNGVLVLTADELWFRAHGFSTELVIPLRDVRGVTLERAWLGKLQAGHPVLVIRFAAGGREDAAGWVVGEPEAWLGQLQGLV